MSVRVEVKPQLLEWAVERSGLDDEARRRAFPSFDEWIAEVSSPTLRQLEDFARRTYTPVGFMFLDQPPALDMPVADFRTTSSKAPRPQAASANLLDVVYSCQTKQDWFRDHQLLNGEAPLGFVGSLAADTSPTIAADALRNVLGWTPALRSNFKIWADAVAALREQAEAVGILVMISGIVGSNTHRKLDPNEFRGLALSDVYAPTVFVNGADSKSAQVFTLAHELAHIWLGQSGLSDLDPWSTREFAQERWCNSVAAELLVPMDEFVAVFNQRGELRGQLDALATQFRVSTQVILGRIREAGFIDWNRYMAELESERQRTSAMVDARNSGGNYYNTKPVQVGKRFARELIGSALEGRTTYTEAFRLLDIKTAATFDGLGRQLGVM